MLIRTYLTRITVHAYRILQVPYPLTFYYVCIDSFFHSSHNNVITVILVSTAIFLATTTVVYGRKLTLIDIINTLLRLHYTIIDVKHPPTQPPFNGNTTKSTSYYKKSVSTSQNTNRRRHICTITVINQTIYKSLPILHITKEDNKSSFLPYKI